VDKIAVSFVASTLAVGGSERVMSELITRLPEERFHKRLYLLREAGPIGGELLRSGIPGAERLQRNRWDPTAAARLSAHLRRNPPDILFVLDHHNAMLWGRLAGICVHVPSQVLASHTTGKFGGKRNFRGSDRWLMEFTDRVVALSQAHARYLVEREAIPPAKIAVIENGVPVEQYSHPGEGSLAELRQDLDLGPEDRIVIMVAALRPEKAHEVLLAAAGRLVAGRAGAKFLIVGDGPRRADLEGLRDRLGLAREVAFLGVRHDVARLLHLADVLVLPSHPAVETLPLAVLEAMAAGVPVVASRVGSVPEVVLDGSTGVLIEPGDALALADAIGYIIENRERAAEMAARARELVRKRFTVEQMVGKYQELFESLAQKRR
jgi:glycosyltransferase involved in cell wall biosynthesis